LFSHPIGAEVRLDVDGEMSRTEAGRDGQALLDLALEWREQFEVKGWTVLRPLAWAGGSGFLADGSYLVAFALSPIGQSL
jgi:hypothetical protein